MVDILATWPGWSTRFESLFRKEQSRHASGRTRTKDLGDSIWLAEYRTKELTPNAIDYWRAVLGGLEKLDGTFDGYALSRCRPIMHPASGLALPAGPFSINVVGGDNMSFTISGATGLKLRTGDMVQVRGTDLYRVENDSDNGASITVTPHLWSGTVTTQAVVVLKPSCLMTVTPGSVQTPTDINGRGYVSFQAMEARG